MTQEGGESRSLRWMANGVLVLASTLFTLAAVEIGLRVTGAVPASMYEADSTLIYRAVPGGQKRFVHNATNGGATIRVTIDDDGYRGPPLRADGKARRVAVFGDSFFAGEFAPDSLTFVRMLERAI
jgi:hypothetical protein